MLEEISGWGSNKIIVVCGATATGKSRYALELAKKIGGVIINADASQVLKGLPILTAQPSEKSMSEVPHYLYGYIDPAQSINMKIWLDNVLRIIKGVRAMGRVPIIVGGTGLYISCLIYGVAEIPEIEQETKLQVRELYNTGGLEALYKFLLQNDQRISSRLAKGDTHRITRATEVLMQTGRSLADWQDSTTSVFSRDELYLVCLNKPRDVLYKDCNTRFLSMIESGAIEEVKNHSNLNLRVIGFQQILGFTESLWSLDEAISLAQLETRRYAKRQCTWFNNQFQYDLVVNA